MPSVVDPSSSEFRVFPPVRRRSRGVGAVSATPLPPRHDFPHFPLVRYPPADRSVSRSEETPQLALPRYPCVAETGNRGTKMCSDGGVPDLRTERAEKPTSP